MKQARKLLSLFLALVMLVTLVPSGAFAEVDQAIDQSPALTDLEQQAQGKLEADDRLSIIVELDGPVLSGVDEIALQSRQQELDEVNRVQTTFSQQIQSHNLEANEIYRYQLLFNGISFETSWQDAKQIANLPGVKRVAIDATYDPPEVKPDMRSSGPMVGNDKAWAAGFKGEGRLVAILDSGADPYHKDFVVTDSSKAMYPTADSIQPLIDSGSLSGKWFNVKVPYGWNYFDRNAGIKEVRQLSGMHGMHVAGTVAANGDLKGVAPEAQLLILRVFGEDGGGTSSSVYLKAIEDATHLRADSANMSLGSPSGVVGSVHETVVTAIRRAAELGTVVNIAGGNEGQFGDSWDLPKADAPDYGIIGTPAVTPMSLAVASMENDNVMLASIILADGTKIPYQMSDTSRKPTYDTFYDVVDGGIGRAEDFTGKEVTGKIALIERGGSDSTGDLTFVKKANNAYAAGAIAAFIYNTEANGDALIGMDMTGANIPGLSIRRSDALSLINQPQQLKITNQLELVESPTKGYMSTFSNWGISTEFDLKPEIAAPGGNIYSTLNDDKYGNMSGTSMATPHVAGGVSLVHQRVASDFNSIQGVDRYTVIKNLLMTYAKPQPDPESGVPISPRKQGAGLMNLAGATSGDLVIEATKGLSKLLLGDLSSDVVTLEFSVKNLGTETVTLPIRGELTTDEVEDGRFTLRPRRVKTFTADAITVAGGQTVPVSITVDATAEAANLMSEMPSGYFLEGYVYLGADGDEQISLPFVGFRGTWFQVPVIEDMIYSYDDLSIEAPFYYTKTGGDFSHLYSSTDEGNVILGEKVVNGLRQFDTSQMGISPNGDNNYDRVTFRGTFLRNYKDVEIRIYPEGTEEPIYHGTSYYSGSGKKNHFSGRPSWPKSATSSNWSWDGKAGGFVVPDGTYYLEMAAKVDVANAETWVMPERVPFKVDTKAPRFLQVSYDPETGWLSFTVSDGEGVGVESFTVTDANGNEIRPAADGRYQIGINADTTKIHLRAQDLVRNINQNPLINFLDPSSDFGSIIITAQTSDGSDIPEYTDKVVNAAGEVQTNLGHLEFGEYTVSVENIQGGYEVLNPSVNVTLTPDEPQANVTFLFKEKIVERFPVRFGVEVAGSTYPNEIQVEIIDENGVRYLTKQDNYLPKYHDADLPAGHYTAKIVNIADGWMSYPPMISFDLPEQVDTMFFWLKQGAGGTITPLSVDANDQPLTGIDYMAETDRGYPVDINSTLAYGTYYVVPKEEAIPEGMYVSPAYQKVTLSATESNASPKFSYLSIGDNLGSITINTLKANPNYPDIEAAYVVEDYYGNRYTDLSAIIPGIYTVRVVEIPDGYSVSKSTQTVTITEENLHQTVDFTFTGLAGTGSGEARVWVNKPYNFRGTGNVVLTGTDGTTFEKQFGSFDYVLRFDVPYDYYVVDVTVPSGYYVEEDFISINVDDIFFNEVEATILEGVKPDPKGSITLFSLEEQNRVGLDGAVYQVINSQGEVVTDLSELPLGEYTVSVLSSPEGYTPVEETKTVNLNQSKPFAKLFFLYRKGQPKPQIVSVENLDDITVDFGTAFEAIGQPSTVIVTLDNDETMSVPVNWLPGSYDSQVAGSYVVEGELVLTDLDITNPQGLTANQTVIVLEEVIDPVVINAVETLRVIYVPAGTSFNDLGLKTPVEVTLDDNTTMMLDVNWGQGAYDAQVPGTYELSGELQIPADANVINPSNLTAKQSVIVLEVVDPIQPVASIKPLEDIEVAYATPFNEINLPKTVTVVLANGSEVDLKVEWYAGEYNPVVTGRVVITGTLVIPAEFRISNPDELQAEQGIVVLDPLAEPAVITAVATFEDITVSYGTDYRDLNLPETVNVTLDSGEKIELSVTWSGSYDGKEPGSYELMGDLQLIDGVTNPDGLTALQVVIVQEQGPRDIVAVAAVNPIRLPEGQTENDAVLPKMITVLLDDQTATELPVVWTKTDTVESVSERVCLYEGELQLPADGSITNTKDLKATLSVMVLLPQEEEPVKECTRRIEAKDRYGTAANIACEQFDVAETVLLASGLDFPDALGAVPLAYKLEAPLLLSAPSILPPATKDALVELKTKNVIILGGESAVQQTVEDAIKGLDITVERIDGANRYETAALVAKRLTAQTDHAYLVSGLQFADAISIGASAAIEGRPILLSAATQLPKDTKEVLNGLQVKQVTLLGGVNALGEELVSELEKMDITVDRLAGDNRYSTNTLVIGERFPQATKAVLASGEAFADALTGSLYAAYQNSPLFISQALALPEVTAQALSQMPVEHVTLLGGENALSEDVRQAVEDIVSK